MAEDHPFIQKNIEYLLTMDGHRVMTAENGKVALRLAREQTPDLIISDVMMPEMNGYEWIKTLRSQAAYQHIPVIYLTALNSEDDRLEGLSKGAVDYISKPFTAREFLLKVKNLLQLIPEKENSKTPSHPFQLALDQLLANHLTHQLTLDEMAEKLNLSKSSFQRRCKDILGQSAAEYQLVFKMGLADKWLKEGVLQIGEIGYRLGFSNASHFSASFRKFFHHTPKQHIKEQQDQN